MFANYRTKASLPLGIRNVKYNKYLVQERTGWIRKRCSSIALQNREWFHGWEEMHLVRTIPLSQDHTSDAARKVYIVSKDCSRGLSAWTSLPFCHFSSNFELEDPSIYGHNMWEIIPLANTCSEKSLTSGD